MDLQRKQMIVQSLCHHFSLDSKPFLDDAAKIDIKTLYSNILNSAGKQSALDDNEVTKWIAFVESFPSDFGACYTVLKELNEQLVTKSVLSGKGLTPSVADVIVFSALHSLVLGLSDSEKENITHVTRWMDYIQIREGLGKLFGEITIKRTHFDFEVAQAKSAAKAERDPKKVVQNNKPAETDPKKAVQSNNKPAEKSEAEPSTKKSDSAEPKKKATGDKVATQEKKKKTPEPEAASDKDKEVSVSLLNLQVGLIRKAWKHPSADSLLVEEIDVGGAKVRQVVSGLAKYCSPDDLTNRLVVLITNVKPGKLRDVVSEGLVLCASSEDHTSVEPLLPPAGAKIGERVSFSGIDGKPEDVLNPKKKQLDKITPYLFTDEKGVATYKGIPFMTSAGPCTSSIPKATIK